MAETSSIEWTDATWNIVTGCTLVDEGCRHCYAARLAATRLKNIPSRQGLARLNASGDAKFTGEVRFNEKWLDQPLRWQRPRRIFVCAHGDLFHENVPDAWIDRVFAVMSLARRHTFQVLTKRPDRMRAYLSARDTGQATDPIVQAAFASGLRHGSGGSATWPLRNVWIGTSVSDQASADARIPDLLATPAAVRFISAEPLLGPVDLMHVPHHRIAPNITIAQNATTGRNGLGDNGPRLDWVIVGGESGPKARPMHPDWARSLRDQCQAAGVAFLFKQWGEWTAVLDRDRDDPDWRSDYTTLRAENKAIVNLAGGMGFHGERVHVVEKVGKSRAGRQMDGREWNDMPGDAQ
ncbi:MAG: phage Gp37/Gp68 family protein [Pseudomonadota bacterium]